MNVPNPEIQALADEYCESVGLPKPVRGHWLPVDRALARLISEEYDKLPKQAGDMLAQVCYNTLASEALNQFLLLLSAGYDLCPWQQDGQPYANSREMTEDVRSNRRLFFFTGGEVHPFLGAYSGYTIDGVDLSYNDIFRAIHDIFGHAAEGYEFGQRGEENAWYHHSMMFSTLARRALTTETRGQNSWFHESDQNAGLPVSERAFAPQKVSLLPPWVSYRIAGGNE